MTERSTRIPMPRSLVMSLTLVAAVAVIENVRLKHQTFTNGIGCRARGFPLIYQIDGLDPQGANIAYDKFSALGLAVDSVIVVALLSFAAWCWWPHFRWSVMRIQLHLSTWIVITMLAGAILAFNVPLKYMNDKNPWELEDRMFLFPSYASSETIYHVRGWPMVFEFHDNLATNAIQMDAGRFPFFWQAIAVDVVLSMIVIIGAAVICELRIRRRLSPH